MSTNTPVFGLFQYNPITDGNLPFNITQALNNNWNAIDSLALPAAAAASPYNPSGTYAVGDFCIYNGTLQKCNTPIPSGEAWNAAHWTIVTLTQLLSPLGGATTAQAALDKLGAGVRPSLVDNGIFVGENLPINQDGKTSWTAYERTVDRWFKEQSGTCSLDVDGFHVSASACVIQTIPDYSFLLGKTITVSILLSDGRYASVTGMCPTASGTDFNILASIEKLRYGIQIFTEYSNYQIGRIDNLENDADVIVVGVKTEEGPNQTLYYVGDDGKGYLLPQNDADYATQLLKCQQYYWDYGPESGGALIVLACTIAGNGKEFNFLIPTSTKMYTPIHFAFESLTVSDLEGNYYAFSKDDFSVMSINSGSSGVAVRFRVTANTGLADGFGVFFGSGLFLEGGA